MATPSSSDNLMETLVSLCKRRGIIYASSEIYGGINGFFDYGPLGAELKRNIRNAWWQDMVHRRDDIVGLESSIIMHPKVWIRSLAAWRHGQLAIPRQEVMHFLRAGQVINQLRARHCTEQRFQFVVIKQKIRAETSLFDHLCQIRPAFPNA